MKYLTAPDAPRVALSVPYPEGAIVQLSRYLSKESHLSAVIAPSRLANRLASRVVKNIPGLGNFSERLNRGFTEVPQLKEVMPSLELRRLWHIMAGSGLDLGHSLNGWKSEFDSVVSRKLTSDANLIVGMPGASLRTFSAHSDVIRVFHEVDSHPEVHNELLLAAYPKNKISPYLHSNMHIARISAEIELSDYVLTPSTFVSQQMQRYGKKSSEIVQVPYGVDLQHFRPTSAARVSGKIELIYVGQMRFGKGLPFLFDAMRESPNVHLSLIGPVVHPAVMDSLPENCSYLGIMAVQALVSLLNKADAFVYPSLEDNFVLAVPEALACGLPVILTDHVGAAEYITPADGVVVPAANSRSLSQAIREISELSSEERLARAWSFRTQATDASASLGGSWTNYSCEVWNTLTSRVSPDP